MARFSITDRGLEELENPVLSMKALEAQALLALALNDDLSPEQIAAVYIDLNVEPSRAKIQAERALIELVKRGLAAPMGTASLRARMGRRLDRVSPSFTGDSPLMSEVFPEPIRTFQEGPVTRRDLLEQEEE